MNARLDPRVEPPIAAPERETLIAFLDYQRDALLLKVAGLDDEALRQRLVPSETTLLGLVKHLAYVERWWFRCVFAGETVDLPWSEDDPDAEFRVEPGHSPDAILALYRDEVARARAIVAQATSLDDVARQPGSHQAGHTLRWILVHMIEETARHNGDADILREQIDGATGE